MIATLVQGTNFSVKLLPGVVQAIAAHREAGQQPDNLCGPYWVSLLLRSQAGLTIRADEFAQLAGSVLPIIDPMLSVPSGATPRVDYQVDLPTTTNYAITGTSAQGLISAIATASSGRYALVPLSTTWTAERVETVLRICQQHPGWNAVPLCNVQTGHFWGANLGVVEAIAYLNGETIQPPAANWDVGHFVALAGQVNGATRSLMVIQDTYPIFGWNGYHLQPSSAVAQCLERTDGSQGGILIFVSEGDRLGVEQAFSAEGFELEPWENGSPLPA